MKVLWLCNIMLPHISEALGKPKAFGGGWLSGMANALVQQQDTSLLVLFPNKTENIAGKSALFSYYGFEATNMQSTFCTILQKEKPDVVHIFGTEFSHTLAMVNACESLQLLNKTVIHIQGLTSIIAQHYNADMPFWARHGVTFRDVIKQDNIAQQKKKFAQKGRKEVQALQKCKHVIGRTDWDKACTTQINPGVHYHFCNETLRDAFYKESWSLDKCKKNTIFFSQAHYPIKGMHYFLKAMPLILKQVPNVHIYTTGPDLLHMNMATKLKMNSYQQYLCRLIKRFHLQNHITFLGALDEEAMCRQYVNSHVFVSASSLENSPNSVGEAMILGVPTVSSDVGGVSSMLTHGKDGFLYPHNAPYMLAYYVCKLLQEDTLAKEISQKAKEHARITHSRSKNVARLMEIYNNLQDRNKDEH